MNRHLSIALIIAAILAAGCSGPAIDEPIGYEPAHPALSSFYEGKWYHVEREDDTSYFLVKSVNKTDAKYKVELWEGGKISRTFEVFIYHARNNDYFVSATNSELKGKYLWALLSKSDRSIAIIPPESNAFKEAIELGSIEGKIEDYGPSRPLSPSYSTYITDSNENLLNLIYTDGTGKYFDWKRPRTLYKERDANVAVDPPVRQ